MLICFSKQKPNGEVELTSRYNDQVEDVRFFVVPGVESVLSGQKQETWRKGAAG